MSPSDPASPGGAEREARRGAASPGSSVVPGAVRLRPSAVLRWSLLGRMAVVSGVLLAAVLVWRQADPQQTLTVTVLFLVSASMSAWAGWRTYLSGTPPDRAFLYAQVAFDVLVVTVVVHLTGGAGSIFAALYIPVIAMAAVLLPFPGVGIIGALCAIMYLADAVWAHQADVLAAGILLQVGLFAAVAAVAGILGDRLRRAGMALGEVESELRRLRMDTGDILATVTSGILTVDEDERLIYLNPAGEALLGLDARQWTGAPVVDAVAAVAPQLAALLRKSLEEQRSLYRRTSEAERDSERLVLGVSITFREIEQKSPSATAVFQDITDSERLALLNRQNERLEAVAALSASMAHEIKNPLACIRSAVEQFPAPNLSGEDRDRLTRMVVRESERLNRLLSDFIDFSRVRMSRRERLDLRQVVDDVVVVASQHPVVDGRTVELRPSLPEESVPVDGDADVLHRALLNLVLNAVQFSPERTSVDVKVEDLRTSEDAPDVGVDRPVRIRVRDRGPGIPAEDLSRVFDPFFTTRDGGSGLGLAMVHRAAEAHEGAIVVEHPPGGGAEFILYLPAGAEPAAGTTSNSSRTEVENV